MDKAFRIPKLTRVRFWKKWQNFSKLEAGGATGIAVISIRNLKTREFYALKLLKPTVRREALEREVGILQHLNEVCEGIVRYYEVTKVPNPFDRRGPALLAIRMDYIAGSKDLWFRLDQIKKAQKTGADYFAEVQSDYYVQFLRELIRQIGSQLQCMHGLGYAHRDVKPENIIHIDRMTFDRVEHEFYLIDFDAACNWEDDFCKNVIEGTRAYMPPEVASRRPVEDARRSDIFGLGATVYEWMNGDPFLDFLDPKDITLSDVEHAFDEGEERLADTAFGELYPPSDIMEALTRHMLTRDPNDRPSAQALVDEVADVPINASIPLCSVCYRIASQECSNCKVPYCSAECQREGWPIHEAQCKKSP